MKKGTYLEGVARGRRQSAHGQRRVGRVLRRVRCVKVVRLDGQPVAGDVGRRVPLQPHRRVAPRLDAQLRQNPRRLARSSVT